MDEERLARLVVEGRQRRISFDTGAPCVLASHSPSAPDDEASFRNEF
jgi:hypothetical protein